MNQLATDAFNDFIRIVPAAEFVKLCNDVHRRTYDLCGAHAYKIKRSAQHLRNAMTGLCMVEMLESMPGLETKRRTAIRSANDELLRHG